MNTIKANRTLKIRNVAKWASLAIAIMLVGLWCASRWTAVQYRWAHSFRSLGLSWVDGRFQIQWSLIKGYFIEESKYGWDTWPPDGVWHFDFKFTAETPTDYGELGMPGCIPAAVVLLPFLILHRADRIKLRRSKAGKCITCGYDGVGLARDAKCPECGKARS